MLSVLAVALVATGCGSAGSSAPPGPSADVTAPAPAAPSAAEPTDPIVYETSAGVIEMPGEGPHIAWQVMESYPPQGGDLPITNWDWDAAPNSESFDGTTWGGSYRLVGTWDGNAFTLTEPPTTTTDPAFQTAYGRPTDRCADADIRDVLAFTGGLDRSGLGIIGSGDDRWDGRCGGYVEAMFDTPELRTALGPMADRIITRFFFHPVGTEPSPPPPTLEPLDTQPTGPTTTSTTIPG